jgi:hypothetical protein
LKEIKDFVKVEDGGVHHKRYNGHYTKQQVKIPKITLMSPHGRWDDCDITFMITMIIK